MSHTVLSALFDGMPPPPPPLTVLPGVDDLIDAAARLEGLKQQMAKRSAGGKDTCITSGKRASLNGKRASLNCKRASPNGRLSHILCDVPA